MFITTKIRAPAGGGLREPNPVAKGAVRPKSGAGKSGLHSIEAH